MSIEQNKFTPPYITIGLYAIERRKLIESQNRATIAAIFKRRAERKQQGAERQRAYRNHLRGIHTWGFCPWCPSNIFYD